MTRFIASIEARMGSSRLPGKTMMLLGGIPALAHLVSRLKMSKRLDGLIIATTQSPADDAIAAWAATNDVDCFRGSEDDVLGRVLDAQRAMQADVVVEVCGDTPFLDPRVVDLAIEAWRQNDVDLVTTARHRSFPDGQDVEVFSRATLEQIADAHTEADAREHVSLPLYDADKWRIHDLPAPARWHRPELRLVLDTAADADFLGTLAAACMIRAGDAFDLDTLLQIIDASAELKALHDETLKAVA